MKATYSYCAILGKELKHSWILVFFWYPGTNPSLDRSKLTIIIYYIILLYSESPGLISPSLSFDQHFPSSSPGGHHSAPCFMNLTLNSMPE